MKIKGGDEVAKSRSKIAGWDLKYFNTGEWQVCDERLKDLEKSSLPGFRPFNPGRSDLFKALRLIQASEVKAVILEIGRAHV